MQRRPVPQRSTPAYPSHRSARFALGLLAIASVGMTGCDTVRDIISPEPEVAPLPGTMPEVHVEGDIQVADPEPGPQGDPAIPELNEPAVPDVVEPVPIPGGMPMPGTMPAPSLHDGHDPVPMPGEPMAPSELPSED